MRRRILVLVTAGIWIGIFVAGLWPFNFIPKNGIRWLPEKAGLHFDDYGQIYGSAPIASTTRENGAARATIELVFTPAKSYNTASAILTLVNKREANFTIGQSLTDLFLQGSFTSSDGKPITRLWIDDVCGRAQELFVTVTLDTHYANIYLDGRLRRSFSVSTRADNISGTVFIGHSASSVGPWSGNVARLAVLDGTLDASEIGRRFLQWTSARHLDKDFEHRGTAYEFGDPSYLSTGAEDPESDLIVPKVFRLSKPRVLEWPDQFNRSVVFDAVVNIAGFIPFGLCTCLCLRLWTGWSIPRCVGTTILVGGAVSMTIELLQVLLPTRNSSLADLVTNILGAAIGARAATIREWEERQNVASFL
jgi:hypothetical protein